MMTKLSVTLLIICISLSVLNAGLTELTDTAGNPIEAGTIQFKLRPEYKSALSSGAVLTGISELDARLQGLGVNSVKPRFRYDHAQKPAGAPDLSLILEARFSPSVHPLAVINSLSLDPRVEYAEPVYIDAVLAVPNDPNYPSALYFVPLMAEAAWDVHKGEDGTQPVILAVMDTGVRWSHADLGANLWNNLGEDANSNGYTTYYNGSAWIYDAGDLNGLDDDGNGKADDLIGWDFMLNANGDQHYDPYESGGHGTSVSGIANARTNNSTGIASLAWNVQLMPLSGSHPGAPSSVYRGYDGILYAAEMGADVINCSWGGTGFSQAAQDVVDYASALGTIVVAAAGNSGNTIPIYPAAYANVIAVASVNNAGVKYSGSNYGGYIDVAAPTESVGAFAGSGYTLVSSATSYASPIASSLTALIRSYNPSWTRAEVIDRLLGSCDNIDALNPGKENALGQGRLNAYRALTDVNPAPDDELRFSLLRQLPPTETNGNLAVEPDETFSLNLMLRNHSLVGSGAVNYLLSSSDPLVNILQPNHSGTAGPDSFVELNDAFEVYVSPSATSKYVSFTLAISADKPIVQGASLSFTVLIQAGGHFVWEGVASGRDMSGAYIRNRLQAMSLPVVYGTGFPASLYGFDSVWLSFGMARGNIVRFDSPFMYNALKDYLESGGRVYIEGGDVVGFDMGNYLPDVEGSLDAHEVLWPLLGLDSASDGTLNPIDGLSGEEGWICRPLWFSASNQTVSYDIDTYVPGPNAYPAFIESAYGIVGHEYVGSYGQRVFLSAYPIAELVDGTSPNTRAELVSRVAAFFTSPAPAMPYIAAIPSGDELLLPIFMQGESVSGINDNRLPMASRIRLTGLNPGSTYRYTHQMVKASDTPLASGAGTPIFVDEAGLFNRVESPSLSAPGSYGSFISDAGGEYTGWFVIEATGDQRFDSGTPLHLRILLNDGAGGTTPQSFLTSSSTLQTLGFGTQSLSSLGTAVAGTSNAGSHNFVFAYDDASGSGRPIAGNFIEDSELDFSAAHYPGFYQNHVSGVEGAYGLIIPNHLPGKAFGGIKRLEARAGSDGSLIAVHSDDDGIWPGGANTVDPSGGEASPIFFTPQDATLPVTLSSFTAVQSGSQALISWTTQTETAMSGYLVWRAETLSLPGAVSISPLILAQNSPNPVRYEFRDLEAGMGTWSYYWLEARSLDGNSLFHGPIALLITPPGAEESPEIPLRSGFDPIWPNPFNPSANLSWRLRKSGDVSLEVYNLRGQLISRQSWPIQAAGYHRLSLDGSGLPSGVYLFRLDTGDGVFVRKAVLAK